MHNISEKQQHILAALVHGGVLQSSRIHDSLVERGDAVSLVTVKRALSEMVNMGLLATSGAGRSTGYVVTPIGRLLTDIDAKAYGAVEPDKRFGLGTYNFELLPAVPTNLFSDQELQVLNGATAEYKRRTADISPTVQKKELERLVIELSWKSSKIEGNTYTLLDTEKLILENKEAPGHSPQEARMILNHKEAFVFVHDQRDQFTSLSRSNLETLHAILVKDLGVGQGLRKRLVGVVGSKYRPLDNIHQVSEAVEDLVQAVARASTPYAKALVALVGISYIQPFEDGNKRTARLMANGLLLAYGCAPLSYRSVDESEYREALLTFYELNSLVPFKRLFIAQYDFAARNYAAK